MSSNLIDESRKRLLAGVRRFQRDVYPTHKDLYQKLAREGQKPHTLFITCADSRIDPELITQSKPGEIFVSRNIGNLVPPYGQPLGGISALVEYAVAALNVNQVIICGHTDCGAMVGLLHPEKVARLHAVQLWLRHAEGALSAVRKRSKSTSGRAILDDLIGENVLIQLRNLRTHPSVAGHLAEGSLAVSGWVYDIAHGVVRIYDEKRLEFVALSANERVSSGGTS
jgi:carbonic anhydrase